MLPALNKGGGTQTESNRAQQKPKQATRKHKKVHTALHSSTRQPKRPNLQKILLERIGLKGNKKMKKVAF
jgi:hypothetical protein